MVGRRARATLETTAIMPWLPAAHRWPIEIAPLLFRLHSGEDLEKETASTHLEEKSLARIFGGAVIGYRCSVSFAVKPVLYRSRTFYRQVKDKVRHGHHPFRRRLILSLISRTKPLTSLYHLTHSKLVVGVAPLPAAPSSISSSKNYRRRKGRREVRARAMASMYVATLPSLAAAPAARKRSGGATWVEGMSAYSGLKGINSCSIRRVLCDSATFRIRNHNTDIVHIIIRIESSTLPQGGKMQH
ncbi:hypothetical protein GUJ93_ZPchr0111g33295 [Zizania palustris]|uniref:Uncharacterized protein n=1 Tax=Zizania palustris TaxID=103762 RepID=A0A8J5RB90_ZIZPA|nr:hypothetical protein GUJ93_ZPchr0111g33295 [Zizania palustris]